MMHKQKQWKYPVMFGFVLANNVISQTPAFYKLESRWEYYTKQIYSVTQLTSNITCQLLWTLVNK